MLLAGWCRQAGRAIGRQQDRVGNGPCEKNVGGFEKHLKEEGVHRLGFRDVNYFMAERFTFHEENRGKTPKAFLTVYRVKTPMDRAL